MTQIIPSLQEQNFETLQERIREIEYFTNIVHLEVMDPEFATKKTFNNPERFIDLIGEVEFDVHLMVRDPEPFIPAWGAASQVRSIIIHEEVCEKAVGCENIMSMIQMVRDYGKKVGIALQPATDPKSLQPILEYIDFVLLMGVTSKESGAEMHANVLEKISMIQSMKPGMQTFFEGGITKNNIRDVKQKGPNAIICYRAIFKEPKIGPAIEFLRKLIV